MTPNTIAAIATPFGYGGIGIIKLSGESAIDMAAQIFKPHSPDSFSLSTRGIYVGTIFDPATLKTIDDVVLLSMPGPTSYTGEDVVELQTHSGPVVLNCVLDLLLKQGAVPAEAGEFSKRAFLNGRIDLPQAEAIIDLINAKSPQGMSAAANNLKGSLFFEIDKITSKLIDLISMLEAEIDFPEDFDDHNLENFDKNGKKTDSTEPPEGVFSDLSDLNHAINFTRSISANLSLLAEKFEDKRSQIDGMTIAIAGRPNVGKSSLLNRLSNSNRAIVSSSPGTTRDYIEETIFFSGLPIKLIDLAGLREEGGEIESLGIAQARIKISESDIVLFLTDDMNTDNIDDTRIVDSIDPARLLRVLNKCDLLSEAQLAGAATSFDASISALFDSGIDNLREKIYIVFREKMESVSDSGHLLNLRQKTLIDASHAAINRATQGFENALDPDIISMDLKDSLNSLHELTGKSFTEDILNNIFKNFCIGK